MSDNINSNKILIGWKEKAALPDLGVARLDAKIDTGAKSSAIHAVQPRPISHDGAECIEFFITLQTQERETRILCVAPLIDTRVIRSSNGEDQERFVVSSRLSLGDRTFPIELTLADRSAMEFQLLIGRAALANNFIVDPAQSYLLGN